MTEKDKANKLLRNKKVIEEINRHLWIESEKSGRDIGFDQAAEDWLKRFSKAWMDYHMPKRSSSTDSAKTPTKKSGTKSRSKKS